jgi:hypothetical protein
MVGIGLAPFDRQQRFDNLMLVLVGSFEPFMCISTGRGKDRLLHGAWTHMRQDRAAAVQLHGRRAVESAGQQQALIDLHDVDRREQRPRRHSGRVLLHCRVIQSDAHHERGFANDAGDGDQLLLNCDGRSGPVILVFERTCQRARRRPIQHFDLRLGFLFLRLVARAPRRGVGCRNKIGRRLRGRRPPRSSWPLGHGTVGAAQLLLRRDQYFA